MKLRRVLVPAVLVLAGAAGLGRAAPGAARPPRQRQLWTLPTTRVKRGDVTITVAARGELQGGNSEMLTAPMIGGGDMAITYLRDTRRDW